MSSVSQSVGRSVNPHVTVGRPAEKATAPWTQYATFKSVIFAHTAYLGHVKSFFLSLFFFFPSLFFPPASPCWVRVGYCSTGERELYEADQQRADGSNRLGVQNERLWSAVFVPRYRTKQVDDTGDEKEQSSLVGIEVIGRAR